MSPIAEARAHLVTVLSAALDVRVHKYPPPNGQAPYVCLVAGSPYRDPGLTWGRLTVALDVRIVVSSASGAAAAERMDDLIDAVCAALDAAVGVRTEPVSAPSQETDPGVLTVEVPAYITVTP